MSHLLAARDHVSQDDAVFWIGLLIVVGCLVAAGIAAFRSLWIAAGACLLVAIVAAFLLL